MKFPFKFIELRYSGRDEFHATEGCQPTHALFYLKKGSFRIEINGKREIVSTGDCYILPDYIYYRRNVIEPIEFVYVKFASNSMCPYTMDIPFGKATFKDKQRFLSSITELEELLSKDDLLSAGYCEHLLLDILFQIHYENRTEHDLNENFTHHDTIVNEAITYINNNLTKKILVDEICKNIGTNASTLNFKFRREFNLSIGQYIVRQRISKACKFLTSTSYSISEIATRCGFEDIYYFSNTFKKLQGVSPRNYRQ